MGDAKKRWEELGKAEKLLLEQDVALVPLYQRGDAYVQKPNAKGIVHHNISPEYSFKWAYMTEKRWEIILKNNTILKWMHTSFLAYFVVRISLSTIER